MVRVEGGRGGPGERGSDMGRDKGNIRRGRGTRRREAGGSVIVEGYEGRGIYGYGKRITARILNVPVNTIGEYKIIHKDNRSDQLILSSDTQITHACT